MPRKQLRSVDVALNTNTKRLKYVEGFYPHNEWGASSYLRSALGARMLGARTIYQNLLHDVCGRRRF